MVGSPSQPNKCKIAVEMTDKDVVERVAAILGVHTTYRKARKENWKDTYSCYTSGDKAITLANKMYGFMGNRRRDQIDRMRASWTSFGLTDRDVLKIRELYKTGKYTQQRLADRFNVSQQVISGVITKKHYTRVA